jgi:glycosyltransferase involved in cell wall biosynthesis
MKILIVTDAAPPQVNGVVITLGTLSNELIKLGHEVRQITPMGFVTVPCPTYPEIRLAMFAGRRVREIIEAEKPDAIHIATEGPLGMAARSVCIACGLAFTTAYHTRFPEYVKARLPVPLSWGYAWMRRFHGKAQHVMVPTPTIRDELAAHGIHHTILWPRGVDLQRFSIEGPSEFRSERPVFMYVAVEKNLEAFLALDLPGDKWVVGGGPALVKLKRAFPEANFAGPQAHADLPRWYRSADVFVFPSLTDTFGLVLLEALACGVPVAAYDVAGPRDVLGDAVHGAHAPGAIGADLQQAALRAFELKSVHARAHAEQFSWERVAQLFVSGLVPTRNDASLLAQSVAHVTPVGKLGMP